MGSRLPDWTPEDDRAFDRAEALTRRVRRSLAIGIPVWLLLLLLLGWAGLGALLGMTIATIVAYVAGVAGQRALKRRLGDRPVMSRRAAWVVAAAAYVLFMVYFLWALTGSH
jgi:hypothetical protein